MRFLSGAAAVLAALALCGTGAFAQQGPPPGAPGSPPPAPPTYEYVQQAAAMTYDGTKITLTGLAPATVFFSDRPYRLVGHVDNERFLSLWDAGSSFASDPPNAALSVLSDTAGTPAIVELKSPSFADGALSYEVAVLSGTVPSEASDVALFIDHGGGFHGGGGGFHGGGGGLYGGGGFHGGGGGLYGGGGFHGGGGGLYGGYHGGGHVPPPPTHYHGGGYGPYYHHHGGYYPPPPWHGHYYGYDPYYSGWGGAAAGFAAGAALGAYAADRPDPTYVYPVPAGPLPANCHLNPAHSRMICSVPVN